MIHLKKLALWLVAGTFLISCDAIDDVTDFDLSTSFGLEAAIAVPEGTDTFATGQINIGYAQVQDIADNVNRIEEVTITSLSYTIKDVGGSTEAVVQSATLNFGSNSIALTPFNPSQAAMNGTVYTVTNASDLSSLGSALLTNPDLTVSFEGTVEGAPVSFTMDVEVDVTVGIDPV